MDFLKLAAERYSVRSFSDKKIEPEKLDKILEAGRLAPTAKNIQPQRIYVLQSDKAIETIRSVTSMAFNAPTVLLICSDDEKAWRSPFESDYDSGEMDASIACTHMMMEAWELGIGSVWVRAFDTAKTKEAFGLPENIRPICLLPIGYAAEGASPSPRHSERLPIEEICKIV